MSLFHHVYCVEALGPVSHIKCDLLSFMERLESVVADYAKVNKNVCIGIDIGINETVSFEITEPFNTTIRQNVPHLLRIDVLPVGRYLYLNT
jgi:hypothetical protein